MGLLVLASMQGATVTESIVCNVCEQPGHLRDAKEIRKVHSNVRAFCDETFTVWRCDGCGSLHCQEDVDLNRYYERYPIKSPPVGFLDSGRVLGISAEITTVRGRKPSDGVLDFGCGPVCVMQFLRERGFDRVSGYDAHVAEYSDPEVLTRQYDVVISEDVIEHMDEPAAFLTQLSRLFKDGRRLSHRYTECGWDRPRRGRRISPCPCISLTIATSSPSRRSSHLQATGGLNQSQFHYRFYYDTGFPTVNYRFLKTYVRKAGNTLDAAFEQPKFGLVALSPSLWVYAVWGIYFHPAPR